MLSPLALWYDADKVEWQMFLMSYSLRYSLKACIQAVTIGAKSYSISEAMDLG